MIQDHFTLLLCLFALVISCIIYQYFEVTKVKKASLIRLKSIHNQINKEQLANTQHKKNIGKSENSEKDIHQKLVTLKTDIVLIDFTLQEIFTAI